MISFPRKDKDAAGPSWFPWRGTAMIRCACGFQAMIHLSHDVDANGVVTPLLDCPVCNFHDYVQLSDWTGVAVTRG